MKIDTKIAVTYKSKQCAEIDRETLSLLASIYPEEKWHEEPHFKAINSNGQISLTDLKKGARALQIEWRAFLLYPDQLRREISQLENHRKTRLSPKLLEWRDGDGSMISRRVVERLIHIQNYFTKRVQNERNQFTERNIFIGSLKKNSPEENANFLVQDLGINLSKFWDSDLSKKAALEMLIRKCEAKGILVTRGVRQNSIFPQCNHLKNVYKKSSGFALSDQGAPLIFLPGDMSLNEPEARQIYTLLFLVVAIGRNRFDFEIDSNLELKFPINESPEKFIHEIVGEVLLPKVLLNEEIRKHDLDYDLILKLSKTYKLSPTAAIYRLQNCQFIDQSIKAKLIEQHQSMTPNPISKKGGPQLVKNSVEQLLGKTIFSAIDADYRRKDISATQVQHLIWGRSEHRQFNNLKTQMGWP